MTEQPRPADIDTPRIRLIAVLPDAIEALIVEDGAHASQLVGVAFTSAWPTGAARDGLTMHLRAMRSDSSQHPWRIRVIVDRASNLVIGSINLKGPPNPDGDVEIGWGIVPEQRRRGLAFEAASAVAEWVWSQPAVRMLSAAIADDNLASQRLAAKLGMQRMEGVIRRGEPLWRHTGRGEGRTTS